MMGMGRPGEILPRMLQDRLKFTPQQRSELEGLQKEVDAKLDKILSANRRRSSSSSSPSVGQGDSDPGRWSAGRSRFGGPPPPPGGRGFRSPSGRRWSSPSSSTKLRRDR